MARRWSHRPSPLGWRMSIMMRMIIGLYLVFMNGPPTVMASQWYSQICPTGDIMAVKIDPTTGLLIFIDVTTNSNGSNSGGGGGDDLTNTTNTTNDATGSNSSSNSNSTDSSSSIPPLIIVDGTDSDGTGADNMFQNETFVDDAGDEASIVANVTTNNNSNGRWRERHHHLRRNLVTVKDDNEDLPTTENTFLVDWMDDQQPAWRVSMDGVVVFDDGGNDVFLMTDSFSTSMTRRVLGQSSSTRNYEIGDVFYVRPCTCYGTGSSTSNPYGGVGNPNDVSTATSSSSGQDSSSSSSEQQDFYLCHSTASYCGLPTADSNQPVQCYSVNMQQVVARNAWPLILLWYIGLIVICIFTIHGHTATEYIKLLLFGSGHNQRFLRRMLGEVPPEQQQQQQFPQPVNMLFPSWQRQRERFEQNLMLQVQWLWRHEEYIRERRRRERGFPPPRLELKVKRYTNTNTTPTPTVEEEQSTQSPSPPQQQPPLPPPQPTTTTTAMAKEGGDSLYTNEEQPVVMVQMMMSSPCESTSTEPTTATTTTTSRAMEPSNPMDDTVDQKMVHSDHYDDDGTVLPSPDDTVDHNVSIVVGGPPISSQEGDNNNNNDGDNEDDDTDSVDGPTCAICFGPLQVGDRIGDLRCNHDFHVDCLKSWLQRKNACPLCNHPLAIRRWSSMDNDRDNDNDEEVEAFHRVMEGHHRLGRPLRTFTTGRNRQSRNGRGRDNTNLGTNGTGTTTSQRGRQRTRNHSNAHSGTNSDGRSNSSRGSSRSSSGSSSSSESRNTTRSSTSQRSGGNGNNRSNNDNDHVELGQGHHDSNNGRVNPEL